MAEALNAPDALRELASPWSAADKIKSVIDRAAKRAGLTYWRTFDLWYSKARRADQQELDKIAEALRIKREREAANELHDLKLRILRMEAMLAAQDPEFHRPTITYVRACMRGDGREDSALAED